MVKRTFLAAGALVLASLALAACGKQDAHEDSRTTRHAASESRAADSSNAMVTPRPSPTGECVGVSDENDAANRILDRDFVALVRVTIGAAASSPDHEVDVQGVEAAEVVAGDLPNGPLREIELGFKGAIPDLAPGEYLLIAGLTVFEGRYYIGNGMSGTFLVSGHEVSQLCPNFQDSTQPLIARGGTSDESELIAFFQQAFASRKG